MCIIRHSKCLSNSLKTCSRCNNRLSINVAYQFVSECVKVSALLHLCLFYSQHPDGSRANKTQENLSSLSFPHASDRPWFVLTHPVWKFPVISWPNKPPTAVWGPLLRPGTRVLEDEDSWMMDETESKQTQIMYRLQTPDLGPVA